MERLTSVEGLEEKLMRDRYANLFFINDLALFPGSDIAVYRIGGLYALNYRNDGMCLFSDGDFDLGEAKAFLDFLQTDEALACFGAVGFSPAF